MDQKTIAMVLFPILLIGPFVFAIFILRKLDQAAQLRKKTEVGAKFRFMIVDFLSLILLIQMPFHFLSLDPDTTDLTVQFLIGLSVLALTLVWFTTIKTVSQAGIVTFKWRALVSMILIPTMYIGCFYFGIGSINVLFEGLPLSGEVLGWLVVSLIGMVSSPWIVRGALNSVAHNEPLKQESKPPDPFAD